MSGLKVVSRERLVESGGSDLWNDQAWQRFGSVRSIALAGEAFSGRLEYGDIGFLSVCRITAAGHQVNHPAEPAEGDAPATRRLKVLGQLHGTCRFQQGHSVVELSPGEFVVYDPALAYTLLNHHAVEQLVLVLPAERLPMNADAVGAVLGKRMSAQSGSGRLAMALLRTALDELLHCGDQPIQHVAESICNLLVDAVRDQATRRQPLSLTDVLRSRVRDIVDNNLSNPELDVGLIADRLNCSKRRLHEVFDGSGTTLAKYIWKRRLERCKDELVNADGLHRSLTDIALAWGFSSSAHFSKAFKQEFGAPPSAFRQRAGPAPGPP